MADQIACVFSTIRQTADGFEPHFVQNMQAGERYSGSIELLPDGSAIPVVKDFTPGTDDLITAVGMTLCYVWADETRVTTADGNANYHVIWRMYTDDTLNPTATMPGDTMTGAELQAILDYLVAVTGYTATKIEDWVIAKMNVSTKQQAVNWATSRPRTATVATLMQAMQRWAAAKAEIEA